MGNLKLIWYEDATTKLAWIQGHSSNILYVYRISATWNRVDRTRGPTWRLSRTIPCAVRVVPSYARTAVVRSKARRIQIQLPGCTQCTNIKSCTTFYQDPLYLVVVYKGLYIQGSSMGITNVKSKSFWVKVICWGENRLPAIACKPSGGMELGAFAALTTLGGRRNRTKHARARHIYYFTL